MAAGIYLIFISEIGVHKIGVHKIGEASDINKRLEQLKSLHFPFVLVAVYTVTKQRRAREAYLHELFADKKHPLEFKWLKRECFDLDTDEVQWCRNIMEQGINLIVVGSTPKMKKLRKKMVLLARASHTKLKTPH